MRLARSLAVLLVALVSACSGGGSGNGGPEDVSGALADIREDRGVPGLAAAALSADGVYAIGSTGDRKSGDDAPVRDGDRWHIGSCTKAMTATVLGSLVEDGVLEWDTTLAEAFPTMVLHTSYAPVTLRQLLAHRGGAPAVIPDDLWAPLWDDGDLEEMRAAFTEGLLERAPEVAPDTQFLYSNAGYIVVGAAMERATGESWEALLQARLFGPLGMESCGFGAPATPPNEVDAPWGHTSDGDPVSPGSLYSDNPRAVGPAGTVHCSLEDWGAFAIEHAQGAKGEGMLLSAASYAEMHTPLANGYALGWGVLDAAWAEGTILTHSGSNTMFFATVVVAPELGRAYVAATNIADGDADNAVGEAIDALLEIE